MTTPTDIANMATDYLDIDPIGNLDTDLSGAGKLLRRNYTKAVDTVIAEFTWNETRTFVGLDEIVLPSWFERDDTDHLYGYAYPPNCLRLIEINGRPIQEVTHDVASFPLYDTGGVEISRQRVILCDVADHIVLCFGARIDAADMGPHLQKAVALELAERCIAKARNSGEALARIQDMYRKTTKGDQTRTGGYQISSRERNPKPPRDYPSTGARARAGEI